MTTVSTFVWCLHFHKCLTLSSACRRSPLTLLSLQFAMISLLLQAVHVGGGCRLLAIAKAEYWRDHSNPPCQVCAFHTEEQGGIKTKLPPTGSVRPLISSINSINLSSQDLTFSFTHAGSCGKRRWSLYFTLNIFNYIHEHEIWGFNMKFAIFQIHLFFLVLLHYSIQLQFKQINPLWYLKFQGLLAVHAFWTKAYVEQS